MINPGELNRKITLQKVSISQDSELNTVESWYNFLDVWANCLPKGGCEFYRLQTINSEINEVFKIRYMRNISVQNRIKFKCKYFEIMEIINTNEANEELLITCKSINNAAPEIAISVIQGVNIDVPVVNVELNAINPSIVYNINVNAIVANVSVNAIAPTITIQSANINIDVPVANINVSAIAPTISYNVNVNAVVANVDVSAISPTVGVASSFTGIFDTLNNVVNAVMVFSPYKKTTANYTGYAVNVKRSSDLTSQDFGFDANGDIDSAAITTFCGAGDGVVTKVYLQTDGTYAYQNTFGNCPKIVSAGTFLTDGLLFDGSNDCLTIDDYTQIQIVDPTLSIYCNYKDNNLNQGSMVFWKNTSAYAQQYGIYKTNTYTRFHPAGGDTAKIETNVKCMHVWKNKSTNGLTVYYNNYSGINYTQSSSLTNMSNFNLACRSSATDNSTKSGYFNGQIKTLVIFNSNEESNLTAIKAAI